MRDRIHILVAHGAYASRKGLAGILSRAGYEVSEACDVDAALLLLLNDNVDVLLASQDLPPSGLSSLLDACKKPPQTVAWTDYRDEKTVRVDHPSVVSVLSTPTSLSEIKHAVATAADQL